MSEMVMHMMVGDCHEYEHIPYPMGFSDRQGPCTWWLNYSNLPSRFRTDHALVPSHGSLTMQATKPTATWHGSATMCMAPFCQKNKKVTNYQFQSLTVGGTLPPPCSIGHVSATLRPHSRGTFKTLIFGDFCLFRTSQLAD
jgi:hypothetical protein